MPSKLIENAVSAFSSLPGIGRKTALRLTLHLLNSTSEEVRKFTDAVGKMRQEIRFCSVCHNVTEVELCSICSNPSRNREQICVVENLRDLIAIEGTGQFNGRYHILGGIISPMDGVGPEQLNIQTLVERLDRSDVKELIMALNPTIEGDTTIYYISRQLRDQTVRITTIARGISFGGELEYVDELTLSRSIAKRLPYENYLAST